MLHSVLWWFLKVVSVRPVGPVFKGEEYPMWRRETSVRNHYSALRNVPEERQVSSTRRREAWNNAQ